MQYPLCTRRLALAGLMTLSLAACGGGEEAADTAPTEDTTMVDTAAQSAAPAAGALADPQVAMVLSVSDSAEIRPSQLAAEKGANAQVKQYAQMMIRDHGMMEDSLRALTQQLGVVPAPSAVSQQIQTQAQTTLQTLQGQSGAAFDRAYMDAMVQSHQSTLQMIDSQLLPATQNPQMRTAIEQKVRPAVQTHLQQAQQLQGTLGGQQ